MLTLSAEIPNCSLALKFILYSEIFWRSHEVHWESQSL